MPFQIHCQRLTGCCLYHGFYLRVLSSTSNSQTSKSRQWDAGFGMWTQEEGSLHHKEASKSNSGANHLRKTVVCAEYSVLFTCCGTTMSQSSFSHVLHNMRHVSLTITLSTKGPENYHLHSQLSWLPLVSHPPFCLFLFYPSTPYT